MIVPLLSSCHDLVYHYKLCVYVYIFGLFNLRVKLDEIILAIYFNFNAPARASMDIGSNSKLLVCHNELPQFGN